MIKHYLRKFTGYKKVGGLHFIRIYKFGFSFYVSKAVQQ
jgi:hypothetical protein